MKRNKLNDTSLNSSTRKLSTPVECQNHKIIHLRTMESDGVTLLASRKYQLKWTLSKSKPFPRRKKVRNVSN